MKNTDTAMATATELLAERRKYEGWLAALHGRRESTPEHVFTRVLADDEARLDAVVAALKAKADSLDARVEELTRRASSLGDDARAIQDERAEAELRAHVGELKADAWEKAAAEADARLEALAAERGSVESELASIRQLLGAARQPTPAQASMAVSGAASPAPASPATGAGADEGTTGRAPSRGADGRLSDVQHDAFASPGEAAAGGDAPIDSPPVDDASSAPSNPVPQRTTGSFDELAFLRDVTGEVQRAAAPLAPPRATMPMPPAQPEASGGGSDGQKAVPASPGAGEDDPDLEEQQAPPERPIKDTLGLVLPDERSALPARRASTEIPLAAHVTGNAPIILETGGKQNKTLKCTDCGSMNYPTEWYCERCGAELSAL